MIQPLQKTFVAGQVLAASELNAVTSKIDEVIGRVNLLDKWPTAVEIDGPEQLNFASNKTFKLVYTGTPTVLPSVTWTITGEGSEYVTIVSQSNQQLVISYDGSEVTQARWINIAVSGINGDGTTVSDDIDVMLNPVVTPLCLHNVGQYDGTVGIISAEGLDLSLSYAVVDALSETPTWTELTEAGLIVVGAGKYLLLASDTMTTLRGTSSNMQLQIQYTEEYGVLFDVGGDITALTGGQSENDFGFACLFYNCTGIRNVASTLLASCQCANYLFACTFYGCTNLLTAPDIVCNNTVTYYNTYCQMFMGCTSLAAAPNIAFGSAGDEFFFSMFEGCTSLATAPTFSGDKIIAGNAAGRSMFKDCTSLATAPVISAFTINGQSALRSMFEGCTALTAGPVLPTSNQAYTYYQMFMYCTSLTAAPDIPGSFVTLPSSFCYGMFEGCTALTTAAKMPTYSSPGSRSFSTMYKGCSALTTAPELKAATASQNAYASMFEGCYSLTSVMCLLKSSQASAITNMLLAVANVGTLYIAADSSMDWSGTGMPEGWTTEIFVDYRNIVGSVYCSDGTFCAASAVGSKTPLAVVVVPEKLNSDGKCSCCAIDWASNVPGTGGAAGHGIIGGRADSHFSFNGIPQMNGELSTESCYLLSRESSLRATTLIASFGLYGHDNVTIAPLSAAKYPYAGENAVYDYTREADGFRTGVFAQEDGRADTAYIQSLATAQSDWRTAAEIINSDNPGYYPAACFVWRYVKPGTANGDWYLPAPRELAYLFARSAEINAALTTLSAKGAKVFDSEYSNIVSSMLHIWGGNRNVIGISREKIRRDITGGEVRPFIKI